MSGKVLEDVVLKEIIETAKRLAGQMNRNFTIDEAKLQSYQSHNKRMPSGLDSSMQAPSHLIER